jgi:hypothetical protein
MTYTFVVRVSDNSDAGFAICEQSVLNSGYWSNTDGVLTLVITHSGTSGALRFRSKSGEEFIICLGVHNYKRWLDIVEDITANDTCVIILPTYYTDAAGNRNGMLWKQLSEIEKRSSKGRDVHAKVTSQTDDHFEVRVMIA